MIAIFMGASMAMPGISDYFKPKIIGRQAGFRVPHGTAPALQRTTPLKKRRAALRPSSDTSCDQFSAVLKETIRIGFLYCRATRRGVRWRRVTLLG
jgi:hypothetical protein